MRVERFMLFFPPILGKVRRGETEYGVGAIPLGGYVKITGMTPHEDIPPELQAPRLPAPARVEADRRDRRRARDEPRHRVPDPGGDLRVAGRVRAQPRRRPGRPEGAPPPGVLQPGDRIVSVDGRPGYEPGLSQETSASASRRCATRQPPPAPGARSTAAAPRSPRGSSC